MKNLCINCKHCVRPRIIPPLCGHPDAPHSEVNGHPLRYCQEERSLFGNCVGRRFELNSPEPPENRDISAGLELPSFVLLLLAIAIMVILITLSQW